MASGFPSTANPLPIASSVCTYLPFPSVSPFVLSPSANYILRIGQADFSNLWAHIEAFCSIIAACLPTLGPLFRSLSNPPSSTAIPSRSGSNVYAGRRSTVLGRSSSGWSLRKTDSWPTSETEVEVKPGLVPAEYVVETYAEVKKGERVGDEVGEGILVERSVSVTDYYRV